MPDKLTDKEIVKAFNNLPVHSFVIAKSGEKDITIGDVADLINRIQVENNRLKGAIKNSKEIKQKLRAEIYVKKKLLEQCEDSGEYWEIKYKTAKAEAYKEFAERLKNEIISDTAYGCDTNQHTGYYDYQIKIGDIPEYIDNLLKELVGDK